jgi:hypothetical protein
LFPLILFPLIFIAFSAVSLHEEVKNVIKIVPKTGQKNLQKPQKSRQVGAYQVRRFFFRFFSQCPLSSNNALYSLIPNGPSFNGKGRTWPAFFCVALSEAEGAATHPPGGSKRTPASGLWQLQVDNPPRKPHTPGRVQPRFMRLLHPSSS